MSAALLDRRRVQQLARNPVLATAGRGKLMALPVAWVSPAADLVPRDLFSVK
jgi:hypothetical protein